MATTEYSKVEALTICYGQRHALELEAAATIAKLAGVPHTILDFSDLFRSLDKSSTMVKRDGDIRDVGEAHPIHKHLPSSFLPGRNYLLLGFAAIRAFNLEFHTIYTGTCQTDFSGYPDCRRSAIVAIQEALTAAMEWQFDIFTPLMFLTKAQTVNLMDKLGKLDWYKHTHTCYNNKRPPCGTCPSCTLRAKGFREAGVLDPLLEV
jgi:7-cyano-7-deazaguanine synthase